MDHEEYLRYVATLSPSEQAALQKAEEEIWAPFTLENVFTNRLDGGRYVQAGGMN